MCIGMANGGKVMTIQEAIEIIDIAIAEVEGNYPMSYAVAFEKAKDVLEKQIKKKPIEDISKDYEGNIIDDVFFCPECTRTICFGCESDVEKNYPYCNCGQALDWSDTK